MEQAVATARRRLARSSALGEHGAAAIRQELVGRGHPSVPSIRTIGRILDRCGLLDGQRRQRRPPPPRGWYLPPVAAGEAELECFDVIEGLTIAGGCRLEVLNGISLHGHLASSWPVRGTVTSRFVVECLCRHWRIQGLPDFAQFDNDTIFQGAHHVPDTFGRVIRLCQQLKIVPVFAPPRETGFQAGMERFNLLWEEKVWSRFTHRSLNGLRLRSDAFLQAHRDKHAVSIDAVDRQGVPRNWRLDLQRPLCGKTIFIRKTDEAGRVRLLGHTYAVDRHWPHRLLRSEVDHRAEVIRFFALRRRDPTHQPLLHQVEYRNPKARFMDR